jgi:hypothetical protein
MALHLHCAHCKLNTPLILGTEITIAGSPAVARLSTTPHEYPPQRSTLGFGIHTRLRPWIRQGRDWVKILPGCMDKVGQTR